MPNICELAAQIALEATTAVNGTNVAYLRRNEEIPDVDAVKAGKPFRLMTEGALSLVHRPVDWIVKRADIESVFPPEPGDFIRDGEDLFRVCHQPDDQSWREHVGTAGAYLRIHTELYEGN